MHEKRSSSRPPLLVAFFITSAFLIVELLFAYLTNSLALLADAGHMLGDGAALGMALWASFASLKKPDEKKSYGYARREVLVAFLNALFLLAVAGYTAVRAAGRLVVPESVEGKGMLAVALAGLAANVVSGAILLRGARHNINVRAALFHVAGDALGSVGVLAASLVILLTGWMAADPIASLVICALIVTGAVRLLRETWHILMEGVPKGFDADRARRLLGAIDSVISVHDIHAWIITSGKPAATAHLVIREDGSAEEVRIEATRLFREAWGIHHVTLQIVRENESFKCDEHECCRIEAPQGHED
jgi:cobalt-zinc-cadmium efflux system protein